MTDRFNGQIPHYHDTNLLERCQEQLRDYDIGYKGWLEPKNHTISYIAAAYLELAAKHKELAETLASVLADNMKTRLEAIPLEERQRIELEIEKDFEAQMENISQDDNES